MDYVALQLDVYNIIKEFGSAGVISFATRTTYNVASDSWTTSSENYTVDMVTVNHKEYDGDRGPKEGERLFLFSAYGLPKVMDTNEDNVSISITFAGKYYEIKNIEAIDPDGTKLLYKAIVRGA